MFIQNNVNKFKNKILLQDNVRFHYAVVVKEFAIKNNIRMLYIPSYSPQFNPIELVFS